MTVDDEKRALEVREGLAGVENRIARACAAAGRSRDEVTLVVVTKFFPVSDVKLLMDSGVHDIGENREQEATAKMAGLRQLATTQGSPLPRLHFVGQLQTNKAGSVASYAELVHSVDRAKLARALDRAAGRVKRVLDVLIQVDLRDPQAVRAEGEADGGVPAFGRGGVLPADLPGLAEMVTGCEHLRLRGLMSVAPLDEDPAEAFARLTGTRRSFLAAHPEARLLSAGMSGDLEAAIAVGATHVRVGSAILGSRPAPG